MSVAWGNRSWKTEPGTSLYPKIGHSGLGSIPTSILQVLQPTQGPSNPSAPFLWGSLEGTYW